MQPAQPIPGIRAVLFDIDGTLVDTLPALIPGLGDMYERYAGHRPSDETIRSIIGIPLSEQVLLYQTAPVTPDEVSERVSFAIDRFEFYKDRERPFGPAIQALARMSKAGFRIGLVTSKSAIELESFLERFDAAPFVDATVCSTDVSHPKPHPESALLGCQRLDVDPRETVLVGDSIYDIRCAKGAGLAAALAVTYGAGNTQALLAEHPNHVFTSPEALFDWAASQSLTPCLERNH